MRRKFSLYPFIVVICLGIIAFVAKTYVGEDMAWKSMEKEMTTISEPDSETKKNVKQYKEDIDDDGWRVKWSKLKNKDAVAWIRFKELISYPILQSDDNSYYLHRDYDGDYAYSGSIFMDYHNSSKFNDDNTLIYGHNMKNGTMFGTLQDYREKSYWKKHKTFYVYTRDNKRRTYRIFNAVQVKPYSDIYTYEFADEKAKKEYINEWINNGLYSTGLIPKKKDKILTLSTCAYQGSRRFVVQAYLVKTVDLE